MGTYFKCQICNKEGKGNLWCDCNAKEEEKLKKELQDSKPLKIEFAKDENEFYDVMIITTDKGKFKVFISSLEGGYQFIEKMK